MKKNNLKRFLASLLAVLMLASVTGVSPAVFADETATPELVETSTDAPKEVLIKDNYTDEQVLSALANALLKDPTQVDANDLSWTYTCAVKGTYKVGLVPTTTDNTRAATVSVLKGDTQTVKDDQNTIWPHKYDSTYTYPSLKDNADGVYTLYLNDEAVYINKVAKLKSAINVVEAVPEVAIPYNEDGSVNTAVLNERIFNAVVTDTTPEGLTYDKLSYPDNLSEGEQTFTISYAGNDDYYGTSKDVKVKFVDGRNVAFTANAKPDSFNIGFVGNDVNVDATKQAVLKQLVTKVGDVDLDKIKVEYMPSIGGIKTGTYKDFSELSTTDISVYYKGIKTDIRLTYAGDAAYKPFSAEFKDLKFADNRDASSIVLKTDASITYNMEKGVMKQDVFDNAIDWDATKLPEGITIKDLTFECNTSLVPKITVWGDIDGKEYPNLNAGDAQQIKISFGGDSDYKPGEFELTI